MKLNKLLAVLLTLSLFLIACGNEYYNDEYYENNYNNNENYNGEDYNNEIYNNNENAGGFFSNNNEEDYEDSNSDSSSSTTIAEGDADSGFRPQVNGFSFENYGNESVSSNMTSVEMERMFGTQVCASGSGSSCILTPPAKQWMNEVNNYMDGGHCEGMAVLSWFLYNGQIDSSEFGNATVSQLSLSNQALQREIAYWWATQTTAPGNTNIINDAPSTVVQVLIETFYGDANDGEQWVMGIYMEDGSGGHAITPYAVVDMGNDVFHIMVYDNNWPGLERQVIVYMEEETWSYAASTNPDEPESLYEGDEFSQTLELVGLSARLGQQDCPFCAGGNDGNTSRGLLSAPTQAYNQIWLNGTTDLLITDTDGNQLGFVDGSFVNTIPGALYENFKFGIDIWDINNEPVYYIPTGIEFSITVDASRATEGVTSDIAMIGPGYNLVVADLYLDPGAVDTITVSSDGSRLAYSTEYNDAPDMIFGVETPNADYEFIVAALDIESGAEFVVELSTANGTLSINTDNTTEYGTYEIVMYRIDDDGEAWFNNDDVYMEPSDTAYLNYLDWEGPGTSMFIDIDYGTDGSIDETIELIDES